MSQLAEASRQLSKNRIFSIVPTEDEESKIDQTEEEESFDDAQSIHQINAAMD